jgi:hypothetical protein
MKDWNLVMKKTRPLAFSALLAVAAILSNLAFTGCNSSGSAEDLIPNVSATFSGTYTSSGEGIADRIVSGNSGPAVTMFRVMQTGNRVQLQDNNNARYHGTVNIGASGADSTPVGNFNIQGVDAVGHKITMIGVFTRSGSNMLVMDGTWLEEDTGRSADIRAFSTSAQALEPTPPDDGGNGDNGNGATPTNP